MEKRQGLGLQGTGLSVYWASTGQPRWIRPFWDIFFPQESHKMCSFQLLNAFKYTGLLGIHLSLFVPRCAFNSNADHRLYSMKCLNPRLVQTYRGSQSPPSRIALGTIPPPGYVCLPFSLVLSSCLGVHLLRVLILPSSLHGCKL